MHARKEQRKLIVSRRNGHILSSSFWQPPDEVPNRPDVRGGVSVRLFVSSSHRRGRRDRSQVLALLSTHLRPMYHGTVLERLLQFAAKHQLIRAGDRVAVAVSGGADSVGLLRLLLDARSELGIVLSVAHFNHKIRGPESDADEAFVCALAEKHDLPFHAGSADTPQFAREHHLGLEAAARQLRHEFFRELIQREQSKQSRNCAHARRSG